MFSWLVLRGAPRRGAVGGWVDESKIAPSKTCYHVAKKLKTGIKVKNFFKISILVANYPMTFSIVFLNF